MISAPSVSGVEAGASWLGGCGQVLTAMTLELPTALPRMLKPAAVKMTDAALRAVNPYGPRIMATTWACMGEPWISRAVRKCSAHRSKACRLDAASLTHWPDPAGWTGTAPGRPP